MYQRLVAQASDPQQAKALQKITVRHTDNQPKTIPTLGAIRILRFG